MNTLYQMSFQTNISTSLAIPSVNDCLSSLGIKYWDVDFADRRLTLRTDFPDFRRVKHAMAKVGVVCKIINMHKINPPSPEMAGRQGR